MRLPHKAMMLLVLLLLFGAGSCVPLNLRAPGPSGAPYSKTPDWKSEATGYSTGLALADINGDGFKDMVVANGNDKARQHVVIFYNDGQGGFPVTPSWNSEDTNYFTNLAVGDINRDGWLDVAVSVGMSPDSYVDKGWVQVYFNQQGQLEGKPSYKTHTLSADSKEGFFSTFSCALGDADGDGDLDLAVADMSWQTTHAPVLIYYNDGGTLEQEPRWSPEQDTERGYNLRFADLNQDGLLDLAVSSTQALLYTARMAEGGSILLPVTASWRSDDKNAFSPYLDTGRLGTPAQPGLVISFNPINNLTDQDVLPGRFSLYMPERQGAALWKSASSGMGGGLVLADVDQDGFLDLITGRWGDTAVEGSPIEIYSGTPAGLAPGPPRFITQTQSVVEALAVADLGNRGLRPITDSFTIGQKQAVVTLSRQNIERIDRIRRNGQELAVMDYASVPGANWISFVRRLEPGEHIEVDYQYSNVLDLAVANMFEAVRSQDGDIELFPGHIYLFHHHAVP